MQEQRLFHCFIVSSCSDHVSVQGQNHDANSQKSMYT